MKARWKAIARGRTTPGPDLQPPTDHIDANYSEGWTEIQGAFWRAGGIAPDLELKDVLPRFTDEAIDVIRDHQEKGRDQPLMLYVAYPAPHTPWLPSAKFEGKSGAGMYGDFMMMVDAEAGRVLATLEDAAMAKDSLVIFTSDNGPVWYEQDVERFGHKSSGGLRGIKGDAWEGGHRMPFIVRWPGVVKPGTVTDQLVCFTDVLATCAEMIGAELESDAGPDSVSFLPTLKGETQPPRPPIVMRAIASTMIRDGDWKLIDALGSGGFSDPREVRPGPNDPEGQLYNLAEDPAETKNLYAERPDIVKRLTETMKQIQSAGRSRP
jgi:arylsulfatase A